MRVVALAALAFAASAVEIGSFESWSEIYKTSSATLEASALNQQIIGASEPESNAHNEQNLWRWYRNVGAVAQGQAKQVMDAASSGRSTSAAIVVADFKTKYDAECRARQDATVTFDHMDKAILTMYDVLGETKPVRPGSVPLWNMYRSFNTDVQAEVKKNILRAPFVKFYTTKLNADSAGIATFKDAAKFVVGTQGTAPTTPASGKNTNEVWKNFKSDDRADLNALLIPVLKANQA